MRKIIALLAIAISGMAAFSSCTKTDTASGYSMTAQVNGVNFTTTNSYTLDSVKALRILGIPAASYPEIAITISNYTGVGTYGIGDTSGNYASIDSDLYSTLGAVYGTITITTASTTKMTGTFSFTCADSTKVTSGSFISLPQK